MGLSISAALALMVGGELDVFSKRGEGSVFTFTALIELADRPETTEPISEVSNRDLSDVHVLVAEDNELNQEVVAMMLEDNGVRCELVSDGEQAIAAARDEPPAIILMDMQMPVMDGMQATQVTLEEHPEIPVIALTAIVMKEDIARYRTSGFVAHVGKPFDEQALMGLISRYMT